MYSTPIVRHIKTSQFLKLNISTTEHEIKKYLNRAPIFPEVIIFSRNNL